MFDAPHLLSRIHFEIFRQSVYQIQYIKGTCYYIRIRSDVIEIQWDNSIKSNTRWSFVVETYISRRWKDKCYVSKFLYCVLCFILSLLRLSSSNHPLLALANSTHCQSKNYISEETYQITYACRYEYLNTIDKHYYFDFLLVLTEKFLTQKTRFKTKRRL